MSLSSSLSSSRDPILMLSSPSNSNCWPLSWKSNKSKGAADYHQSPSTKRPFITTATGTTPWQQKCKTIANNKCNSNYDTSWSPNKLPIDVRDELDAYVLTADVPGVDKKHIIVEVGPSKGDWRCGGYITITVKRKSYKKEKEEEGEENGDDVDKMELESRYIRRERWSGRLCRKVELPEGVQKEDVSARLKGGVLVVVMEKKEEAKVKRVDVKEKKDGGREEGKKGWEGGEGPPLQWTASLDDV